MTAGPVLQLEARDALEFALLLGEESEPCRFGVSRDPEIVAADHLTTFLSRGVNFAIGGRCFLR